MNYELTLKKDFQKFKKGHKAHLVSNPGRGIVSAYYVLFEGEKETTMLTPPQFNELF